VKSREGAGSEFTFLLSFSATTRVAAANTKKYASEDLEALKQLNILVVEDSPINVKFIFALFENNGLTADHAENGKVAIEMMKSKAYDLILMDIEMPEMNGYETTTYIRGVLESSVPIIAMTAHTMAGESEKCIQMGMDGYISKPVREDVLFSKMIHVGLSRQRPSKVSKEPGKLVDLSSLEKTMRGNGKVIRETLEIFLEHLPENLRGITDGTEQGDFGMIRRNAHTMKSSVSILGIQALRTVLEEMEQLAAAESELPRITELKEHLVSLCERAVAEIEELKQQYTNQ
jgi:CheY-like chemotaxis protein